MVSKDMNLRWGGADNRGESMNFRTIDVSFFSAAGLAGCNMADTPDPTLNAKDREFLSLAPKAEVAGEYGRYIVDDPTGAAPGTITVDTFKNFLYFSLPNKKAIRYGVATGREAAGWTGEATVGRWPNGRAGCRRPTCSSAGRT